MCVTRGDTGGFPVVRSLYLYLPGGVGMSWRWNKSPQETRLDQLHPHRTAWLIVFDDTSGFLIRCRDGLRDWGVCSPSREGSELKMIWVARKMDQDP